MKPVLVMIGVLGFPLIHHTSALATNYDTYLGSWSGTWKSNRTGSSDTVTLSCREGSSLGPNCTAKVTPKRGDVRILSISPDVQGNGTLRWKNGPLDYKFGKVQNGKLRVDYVVTKDTGVWNLTRD